MANHRVSPVRRLIKVSSQSSATDKSSCGPAGECIYKKGEYGEDMYIIQKGKVARMGSEGLMEQLLGPGEHFGDTALLLSANRKDQAVALAHSDLMALRAGDLAVCMKSFTKSASVVRRHAMEKYAPCQLRQCTLLAALCESCAVRSIAALVGTSRETCAVSTRCSAGATAAVHHCACAAAGGRLARVRAVRFCDCSRC